MTPNELANAILESFGAEFIAKFHKGQLEHGGYFLEKPGMLKQAENEVSDLVAYKFAIRYQIQSALDYAIAGDFESCKVILTRLLGEPSDK